MSNQPKQRTASERIEDLENAIRGLFESTQAMAGDVSLLKNAIRAMNNKLDATIKVATDPAGISAKSVAEAMVENNIAELKGKVDNMLEQNLITAEQTVTAASFVVGQEVDKDGTVVNPRLQFSMGNIPEDVRSKIVGAEVGQTIQFEEGKLGLLIQETYSVVQATESAQEDHSRSSEENQQVTPEVSAT